MEEAQDYTHSLVHTGGSAVCLCVYKCFCMETTVCVYCIGICVSVPASITITEYYLGSGLDKCLGFALKLAQLTGVCAWACACACVRACVCEKEREIEAWTLHLWAGLFFKSFEFTSSLLPYCWQRCSQSWKMEFLALNSSHPGHLPVSYSVFIFWSDTLLLGCPCFWLKVK